MRIVNRREFLDLPRGTLYSRYETFGTIYDLKVKLETLGNDWIYQDIIGEINTDNEEFDVVVNNAEKDHNYEFELDMECGRRDGMFDDEDMFVIYNEEDITRLVSKLQSLPLTIR